jgi:hypothetical protein
MTSTTTTTTTRLNHLFMVQVDRALQSDFFDYLDAQALKTQLTLPFSDGDRNSILVYFFCNKAKAESIVKDLTALGIPQNDLAVVPLALVKEANPIQTDKATEQIQSNNNEDEAQKKKGALAEFYATVKARIAVENMLGKCASLSSCTF